MDREAHTSIDSNTHANMQERIAAHLSRAQSLLHRAFDAEAAIKELESALAQSRAAPYEIEFRTRVTVALTLADAYLSVERIEDARRMLSAEVAFALKVSELVQATGTVEQKRAAAGCRVQLEDRARQLALIGETAPEIAVAEWLRGDPASLSSLRGRVVLLEFWATWCQPCRAMFAKLRELDAQYRTVGLEVIALTRYYFASRATASTQAGELELMRRVVQEEGLEFRVGVAADERLQELYGANGLPALALIDRAGIVRYANFGGGDDKPLIKLLHKSLESRVKSPKSKVQSLKSEEALSLCCRFRLKFLTF